jgi:hypothetical protein
MLEHALAYAAAYRPVFPCNPRPGDYAKAPLVPKKEGGRGHLDATCNADQIRTWWQRWPGALIGSPVPHDLICVDIDPRSGATVAKLETIVSELPYTQAVISGRGDGGIHLFYWRPLTADGRDYRPISTIRLSRVLPGVDIKLNTGYTILPPSLHPDTRAPYEWRGDGPSHRPPAGQACGATGGATTTPTKDTATAHKRGTARHHPQGRQGGHCP